MEKEARHLGEQDLIESIRIAIAVCRMVRSRRAANLDPIEALRHE